MQNKSRSACWLIALALLCQCELASSKDSPFVSSLLGRCFSSVEEAKWSVSGTPGDIDENITVLDAGAAAGSHWIIDRTSGTNSAWYLVQRSADRECITLFVPFAADAYIRSADGKIVVVARTQAAPGSAGFEMRFQKSANLGHFVPTKCERIEQVSAFNSPVRKAIDCLHVGD